MNTRQKKLLSQQLLAQAKVLEQQEGPQLAVSVTAACSALLKAVSADVETMDPASFENLYASFSRLAQQTEAFFEGAQVRLQAGVQTPGQELSDKRQQAEQLRARLEEADQAVRELEHRLADDRARLEEAQKRMADAEEAHSTLCRLLDDCSDEKIAARLAGNELLKERFAEANLRMHTLTNEHDRLLQQLHELETDMEKIPQQNRELVERCGEQEKLLERLRNAFEIYSPEGQAALQKEIDALSASVEENQQAAQLLKSRLDDLQAQHTEYDAARQTLSTNLLDLLQRSMGDLQTALDDHEEKLSTIRTQAETLTGRLAACLETRRRCSDWLDADITPLEAMIRAVDRPEAAELRRTLDPGSIHQVQQLYTEIEQRLQQLDDILRKCTDAVRLDQGALDKLARR